MMDRAKALKALSQALRLEQEGRAFYLQAAERTADAQGRAMFLSLADDERQHAEMIQVQLHGIEGEGVYVLLPDVSAAPIDVGAKLFPPERQALEAKVGDQAGDLQALFLALENEIKSFDLYVKAAQETDDAAGKQMYRWLAGAERIHFNLLMSNYESMAEKGSWV
jgi:rubrerythrin